MASRNATNERVVKNRFRHCRPGTGSPSSEYPLAREAVSTTRPPATAGETLRQAQIIIGALRPAGEGAAEAAVEDHDLAARATVVELS